MATRKGWDALKADYRERLERKGITRAEYEGGASIKAGRGHGHTPERPRKTPTSTGQDYSDYWQRRDNLERRLIEKKAELFGDRPRDVKHGPRWVPERSAQYIKDFPPSMKLLQWAIDATEDEIIDAIRDDPDTYAFLGYH